MPKTTNEGARDHRKIASSSPFSPQKRSRLRWISLRACTQILLKLQAGAGRSRGFSSALWEPIHKPETILNPKPYEPYNPKPLSIEAQGWKVGGWRRCFRAPWQQQPATASSALCSRPWYECGSFRNLGVPYFGVLIIGSYYLGYYIRLPYFGKLPCIIRIRKPPQSPCSNY